MTDYIDITPTWEGLVYEMLRILPHATAEGAADIHKQILHAARVADLHVAQADEGAAALLAALKACVDEMQEGLEPDYTPEALTQAREAIAKAGGDQ